MADAVTITSLPPLTRLVVRAGEAATAALRSALDVDFPREACRAAVKGELAVLWLGPDEWLVLAPDGRPDGLSQTLTHALRDEPASIVEVSDRQVAIGVSGPKAAEALNAFNPLDLHIDTFPVGMVARTPFGKAQIVLWRKAPDFFHVEVWRSFAPYLLGCLAEATREYA